MSGTFRVNSRSAVRGFASRLVQYVGKEALLTGSDWICLKRRILGTMTMMCCPENYVLSHEILRPN